MNKCSLLIEILFVVKLSIKVLVSSFTDSRTSRPMIPRDIDDSTDPNVDDEKPSYCGFEVRLTNCRNVNN